MEKERRKHASERAPPLSDWQLSLPPLARLSTEQETFQGRRESERREEIGSWNANHSPVPSRFRSAFHAEPSCHFYQRGPAAARANSGEGGNFLRSARSRRRREDGKRDERALRSITASLSDGEREMLFLSSSRLPLVAMSTTRMVDYHGSSASKERREGNRLEGERGFYLFSSPLVSPGRRGEERVKEGKGIVRTCSEPRPHSGSLSRLEKFSPSPRPPSSQVSRRAKKLAKINSPFYPNKPSDGSRGASKDVDRTLKKTSFNRRRRRVPSASKKPYQAAISQKGSIRTKGKRTV